MTEVRVPWKPHAGETLVIEPDIDPITPISSLQIIQKRVTGGNTAGILLTVRTLAQRDFAWRRISDGAPLSVGGVSTFSKPAGFEFDIYGQAGESNQWAIVYADPARDRMLVTRGFYLVDWPGE